jgi:superfamily II DNA or RNA helicase
VTAEHDVEPHDLQRQATAALREMRSAGEARALAVLAPGLGKTLLAAFDIEGFESELGRRCRVLYLAHRAPILDHAERSFRRVFGGDRSYGQHVADRRDLDSDMLFASFQSFPVGAVRPDHFDYVVVDEAHHTPAPTYNQLISVLRPTFRLGLTATPFRGDGQDVLYEYGDNVAILMPIERALAQGWLTPIDYRVYTDIDDPDSLRGLLRGGAGRRQSVAPRTDDEIVATILREAATIAGRRSILVFCADLEQMYRYARLFDNAATVSGDDGRATQLATIRRFAGGEVEVLLSRDVLNEGLDVPDASTIVFLRNTESPVVFLQQLGRGLRTAPGKDRVVVLDFVANLDRIEFLYGFHSRLVTAQRAEASKGRVSAPRSTLRLDAAAKDVIKEIIRKKIEGSYLVDLEGLSGSFDYRVSTATLRRMVIDGRLEPDVIAPGTDDLLFDTASVRQLHRRAQTSRHMKGLISERDFASAIRQPVGWVRRMQERGSLPATWIHRYPNGVVGLFFTEDDIDRHRQAG